MIKTLELFCDEAGSTGPALLDPDQRYFAFSSVALSNEAASDVITRARQNHPVQMPELKASKLLRTTQGRSLLATVIRSTDNFAVTVFDKVLALSASFFEYVYEPVFKADPSLLYQKSLHRFVAMILWTWFTSKERDAEIALQELQTYLRTLDPECAPLLFGRILTADATLRPADPFDSIVRFARASRDKIIQDNSTIPDVLPQEGRWLLDLSATSLWSHLNHWGRRGLPIAITCDESKPLKAVIQSYTGDDRDPGIRRSRLKGHKGGLGWKYSTPPVFGDSRTNPAIQVADLIAGAAAYAVRDGVPEGKVFRELLCDHVLESCVLPDFSIIDPSAKSSAVNAAILFRITQKAEQGIHPENGLEFEYAFAEAHWDAGGFRLT